METIDQQNKVTYRQATEADFPVIASMYEKLDQYQRGLTYSFPEVKNVGELYLDTYRRTLGRYSVLFVAEYQGKVVAFNAARIKRVPAYLGGVMVGELNDIWVEPDSRRLKIGDRLTRLAIEWCRDKDVHSVELQVLAGNEASIKLVEASGLKLELYQMRLNWEDYPENSDS